MSYSDLLETEGLKSEFLAVIELKRKISGGFSNVSGEVYFSQSFTFGPIISLSESGVNLTEGSLPLSQGEYYYDTETQTLYVRLDADVSPNSGSVFLVAEYEIYVGTFDAAIGADPTDINSRQVYYEPLIVKSPKVIATKKDILFGSLPVNSFSINCSNATGFFNRHLVDSSFYKNTIKLYHWLGDLDEDNVKLVLNGVLSGVSYSDQTVSISGFDIIDQLNTEFRGPEITFADSTTFSGLDPNKDGAAIAYHFGRSQGNPCINVDFNDDAPTTSNNRVWLVASQDNLTQFTGTVPASPSSTSTRTYLDSVSGLSVGDSVKINKASVEYVVITNVDRSSTYIEHATVTGNAMSGDTVVRESIPIIHFYQGGVKYSALAGRDYTINSDYLSTGATAITFTSGMETTVGSNTLSGTEQVASVVYGKTNTQTLGGSSFGSNGTITANLSNPVIIIYDLLKNFVGLTEGEINSTAFTQALSDVTDEIGFAIPLDGQDGMPKYKDIIVEILRSSLLTIYLDSDRKYALLATKSFSTADSTIDDTEILDGSFSYDFDYTDLASDVVVEYNAMALGSAGDARAQSERKTASSDEAKYIHSVNNQYVHKTLLIDGTQAQTLANKIRSILGTPKGTISLSAPKKFLDTEIGEQFDISRIRFPGFTFDRDTERTASARVIKTSKSKDKVDLELDDQEGIENSSDF